MVLYKVQATIESISNITVARFHSSVSTIFDATINGQSYKKITLSGSPTLVDGMTVTAILEEVGNWYTVRAW